MVGGKHVEEGMHVELHTGVQYADIESNTSYIRRPDLAAPSLDSTAIFFLSYPVDGFLFISRTCD